MYQTLDDHLSKQCKRYDLSFEQKNREVSQIKQKLEEIQDLKVEIQNLHSSDKEIHNQIYDLMRDFEQTYATVKDIDIAHQELARRVFKSDFLELKEEV